MSATTTTPTTLRCTRLAATLSTAACAKRYVNANGERRSEHSRGANVDMRFVSCRGCGDGERNAVGLVPASRLSRRGYRVRTGEG